MKSVMYRFLLFIVLISYGVCSDEDEENKIKIVKVREGYLQGEKYWNGDFHEFFGVPYATAPKGRDRFKAPLPAKPWEGVFAANRQTVMCHQTFYTGEDEEEIFLNGEEECLTMNILVPLVANQTNLVPVVVYVHSGAFAGGSANMAKLNYIARHDVIAISINYRVGALGFACLGTEEIPGNAALKDQLAALKWINKNIKQFGGDPSKVTLAGYSVGATLAELLAISEHTDGLIDKLILESGSALTPFAINRDPINTARNIAISFGYNDTGNIQDLNEFYLEASDLNLAIKSLNFFLPNSTFGFAPCIESKDNRNSFLTESPLDTLKKGINKQLSILTGFCNMEGLSRSIKFGEWSKMMNEKFDEFLPADLIFNSDNEKSQAANEIKSRYFKENEITNDNRQEYVDYFSDSMFKYAIMKSLKMHSSIKSRPTYLYEFSYVGELNMKHNFVDKIKGASHRDQTAYILDFFGWTDKLNDLDTRDRLTWMWTDFAKYGNPTAFESQLMQFKWQKYSNDDQNYLAIGKKIKLKKDLFQSGYEFWNKFYDKYYWNPTPLKLDSKK